MIETINQTANATSVGIIERLGINVEQLAEAVTKQIFKDCGRGQVTRIACKIARSRGELDDGGLCRSAFKGEVQQALQEWIPNAADQAQPPNVRTERPGP